MTELSRHLITTAEERSWKYDCPVLFLGEWCCLYERNAIWMSMDAEVAQPFRMVAGKQSKDIEYVQALSSRLLTELAEALNSFHNTNHSPRYWNILLGHWLQRHVDVCFNRYFTIEKALKNYRISSTTVLDSGDYSLATTDSFSFMLACSDDLWNNVIYARVLKHMECKNIDLELTHVPHEGFFEQKKSFRTPLSSSIRQLAKASVDYIFSKLSLNSDAFIINSYLSKWQEIKLQLALWQYPQLWKSPALKTVVLDPEIRTKFILSNANHNGFEQFVRDVLPDMIPTCFLEGYAELSQQVESLPWPSKPKFIFTSNNFDTDEIFKAWVGIKAEQGVPYYLGQHGNNYGTMLGVPNLAEQRSADKFFTWGWTNGDSRNIPAFIFKKTNQQIETRPHHGGLLLVEMHAPYLPDLTLLSLDDHSYEFGIYQEQQFRFVEALPASIQNELTVRLHDGWVNVRWSDHKRWSDRIPSISLDAGNVSIQGLIAKQRLVVYSYDSTGILEGLASNIPTLCFWNSGLNHLLPIAKPYYELLRRVGILADSPEHAAQLVTQYWDNIDEWWNSKEVQSARVQFCEQYARVEKRPVQKIKQLLMVAAESQKK